MFKNRGKKFSLEYIKLQKKAERIHKDYYHSSCFELYIDDSKIKEAGLGVFTNEIIPKNTIIDEYKGELVEISEYKFNPYMYSLKDNQSKIIIDASKLPRCYMGMLNDSINSKFKNNCEFEPDIENKKVYIVSTRDIQAGEELFIGYGYNYWFTHESGFNLYIEDSQLKNSGLGVYTNDDIPENTIIDEYRGELIESFDFVSNPYSFTILQPDKENNIKGLFIDPSKLPRCYMAMINDASLETKFTNNCDFEPDIENKKVYVVSTRDIGAGEELFVSYGEDYWASPQ